MQSVYIKFPKEADRARGYFLLNHRARFSCTR